MLLGIFSVIGGSEILTLSGNIKVAAIEMVTLKQWRDY